jgi:hypothetical protein
VRQRSGIEFDYSKYRKLVGWEECKGQALNENSSGREHYKAGTSCDFSQNWGMENLGPSMDFTKSCDQRGLHINIFECVNRMISVDLVTSEKVTHRDDQPKDYSENLMGTLFSSGAGFGNEEIDSLVNKYSRGVNFEHWQEEIGQLGEAQWKLRIDSILWKYLPNVSDPSECCLLGDSIKTISDRMGSEFSESRDQSSVGESESDGPEFIEFNGRRLFEKDFWISEDADPVMVETIERLRPGFMSSLKNHFLKLSREHYL